MKNEKKKTQFSGTIQYISCSPHGDPEGIVLSDGSFVKVPPHSLVKKDLFDVGAMVTGSGELISKSPNKVIHHAKVQQGKNILADDSIGDDERESLKKQHKKDLKKRKDAPSKKISLKGNVVAVSTKPKGEVDRLIFDDGTSVHIPKEIELLSKDVEIGDRYEAEGESRSYKKDDFLKPKALKI